MPEVCFHEFKKNQDGSIVCLDCSFYLNREEAILHLIMSSNLELDIGHDFGGTDLEQERLRLLSISKPIKRKKPKKKPKPFKKKKKKKNKVFYKKIL